MRDYLNAILQFIGAESLTDEEFDSIDLESTEDQVAVYNVLLAILEARELVSEMRARLQNYFLAQGTQVSLPAAAVTNIFVGGCIE
jgi:hypothetical protein